ncbi:MAG: radical SAM protein [Planctomycetes bacterium]|nr:radical SAM protein [Planctomycetota bacterium]
MALALAAGPAAACAAVVVGSSRGRALAAGAFVSAIVGASLAAAKADNSRLLREDIAARRTTYRGLPEVVTLNHSDICNLRCVMCQRSLGQGTNRLDRQVLDHVAHELFPTAWKAVLTTAGGDPLAVDFDFLLEHALRFGVRLDVVTNGMLLTRDVYLRARGAIDHLNVSLDSHVPEVYERIRAGSSHARVWRNLEHLACERHRQPDGVLFSLSAVVMKSNLPHLADFLRAVAPLQPDGVVLQQLQHAEKPTPEEEPTAAFSGEQIERHLVEAERAARTLGLNLFLSEFRRPNIISHAPRPKVPMTIEGHGLCWFLAQNFNVMYTGEVFPCCIPTDLCLGDVRYQDPVEIWNGEPFRRLREQHLTGGGNLFCSGCLHAPHLPPRPDHERLQSERERRAKAFEVASGLRRAHEDRTRRPIFAADLPQFVACDGGFADAVSVATVQRHDESVEAAVASEGGVLSLREGTLERRTAELAVTHRVDLRETAAGARGSCVHWLGDGVALVGFEGRGALFRVDATSCTAALRLSDPRSFVRTSGVAVASDGAVWVGEYGVFPGARCAWVYRSTDGARTFEPVTRFQNARHVHRVLATANGDVLVTTGDLAAERRLYRLDRRGSPQCLGTAWSGFVAACEHAGSLHFGTELLVQNGLVAYRQGLEQPPEFRPLPAALDLKVRSIVSLADGTLLALLGMDADLPRQRIGRQPAVLASRDHGRSWFVVHRFADWDEEPDDMVALGGSRAWAFGGLAHHVIGVEWGH